MTDLGPVRTPCPECGDIMIETTSILELIADQATYLCPSCGKQWCQATAKELDPEQ
jgi:predicted RNA-binding Zn-ribbon protein involved in translation (DUF1610 family)